MNATVFLVDTLFSLYLMVWKQEDHKNFIFQHHYDEHMFITQQS